MHRRLPPLNSLRAFEVVSRHESFRAAAEELHVTAAAVSQQVKALEDHLGRKLLRRRSGGYSLTADALAGLKYLRDGFDQLSSAVASMTSAGQRVITVSAVPSLAAEWLVPRLHRLRDQYPELDMLLHASEELVDLEHSRVDLGIRYGSGSYPGLTSERLFVDEIFPRLQLNDAERPNPSEEARRSPWPAVNPYGLDSGARPLAGLDGLGTGRRRHGRQRDQGAAVLGWRPGHTGSRQWARSRAGQQGVGVGAPGGQTAG